ncbi:hypothetical protein KEM48_013007 [Puccinia striiformis f. sp. tritici PST-130]|nr:hypothetical protein KEM48_013007 [Puccinia striiformis f. sp. tritici PST-130]
MFINTEVSRYSRPSSILSKTAEPLDSRDVDWRQGPDHRYDCNITNPDRRPSSWSHQEGGIISPGHLPTLQPSSPSPHHCPSDLRPRSPSPPPRRMQTSIQGASRAHMHPDLSPAKQIRPSPASSCALPEDRPIQAPEQSDLIQQNPASWYNAYRPSPSFPSETNGVCHHDVRRGDAYYPWDQGPHSLEPNQLDIRRSQVLQHIPNLPEQPKVLKGMSQPDFYCPSSRPLNALRLSSCPIHASGVSPRQTQPMKQCCFQTIRQQQQVLSLLRMIVIHRK